MGGACADDRATPADEEKRNPLYNAPKPRMIEGILDMIYYLRDN
jgi:hypothetical protein